MHVTIIGGGIAGLATAFYLQKKSREQGVAINYTLVESDSRFGGKISTTVMDDFIIEGGPDSFITQKPGGMQLSRDLGLTDRLIPTNDDRRNIYVLQNGKLVPFPGGYRLTVPTEFIPFATSPLISPLGKLRMGLDLIIPPRREAGDESLADFIRRRLGSEALDKIAGPVMAGIYVADPENLSLQSTFPQFAEMEQKYGSLIKAMRASKKMAPTNHNHRHNGGSLSTTAGLPGGQPSTVDGRPPAMFTSLRGGMGELVEALVARLEGDLRPSCRVIQLQYLSPGFEITLEPQSPGAMPHKIQSDAVVLAIPAYVATKLLEPIAPQLAALLARVRYVSTATVSLGYRRADLPPHQDFNGFGFMIPRSEKRQIIACTWSSTKFNYRAPAGDVLVRIFIGGDGQDYLVDTLSDAELIDLAQREFTSIMGLTAQPVVRQFFRWTKGNPQYDVGHLDRVAEMEQLAAQTPGLYLTGSAFRGIGIPDCVKSAIATAENLILAFQHLT